MVGGEDIIADGFIDSQLITLSGVGPKIETKIPCPIELNHELYDYKIGLKKFQTYYAFPNITENVNNQLLIRPGGSPQKFLSIRLPTGAYEIDTIHTAILSQLKAQSVIDPGKFFNLAPDTTTFKTIITLSNDWSINFNVTYSISSILGFDKKTLLDKNGDHYSSHTAQIQGFNSLLFLTNVTYPSIINDKYVPYIYHYSKNSSPGYNIVVSPNTIAYKSLTTNILSSITVWVEDENGHPVNFNHEELTVELKLIRKIRKQRTRKRNSHGTFILDYFG